MSYAHAIVVVEELADEARRLAEALRALREPEAARAVARLADNAARAATLLAGRFDPEPGDTERYSFHRDLWVRYGDPGDLEAMTDHVTPHAATEVAPAADS